MQELRVWLNASGIDRGKVFRRATKLGKTLGEGLTEKAVWHIVKDSAKRSDRRNLLRTTFDGPLPDSATPREESWSRSSSFWAMYPFKRRNTTWAESNEFGRR